MTLTAERSTVHAELQRAALGLPLRRRPVEVRATDRLKTLEGLLTLDQPAEGGWQAGLPRLRPEMLRRDRAFMDLGVQVLVNPPDVLSVPLLLEWRERSEPGDQGSGYRTADVTYHGVMGVPHEELLPQLEARLAGQFRAVRGLEARLPGLPGEAALTETTGFAVDVMRTLAALRPFWDPATRTVALAGAWAYARCGWSAPVLTDAGAFLEALHAQSADMLTRLLLAALPGPI